MLALRWHRKGGRTLVEAVAGMTWTVVFVGLIALVVSIYLATRFWSGLVERQRPERQRRFLADMREASSDEHDPPEGNQRP